MACFFAPFVLASVNCCSKACNAASCYPMLAGFQVSNSSTPLTKYVRRTIVAVLSTELTWPSLQISLPASCGLHLLSMLELVASAIRNIAFNTIEVMLRIQIWLATCRASRFPILNRMWALHYVHTTNGSARSKWIGMYPQCLLVNSLAPKNFNGKCLKKLLGHCREPPVVLITTSNWAPHANDYRSRSQPQIIPVILPHAFAETLLADHKANTSPDKLTQVFCKWIE